MCRSSRIIRSTMCKIIAIPISQYGQSQRASSTQLATMHNSLLPNVFLTARGCTLMSLTKSLYKGRPSGDYNCHTMIQICTSTYVMLIGVHNM